MPTARAKIAIATCQLSDSLPSHEEKISESAETRTTEMVENRRIDEKVFNFALSITSTVARFHHFYAKMRA
jgi:hypothetical protein